MPNQDDELDDFDFDEREEQLTQELADLQRLREAYKLVRLDRQRAQASGASDAEMKSPMPSSRVPQGTWENFIPDAIDTAGRGLRALELLAMAKEAPAFKDIIITHMSVAKGVAKLAAKGIVEHRGTKYYTPSLVEKLGAENIDAPSGYIRREKEHGIIVDTIMALPGLQTGLTSSEIIAEFRKDKGLDARIGKGAGAVYNALKRLVGRGKLERDDGRYRLAAPQTNEAPEQSDASSGQVNGADDPKLGSNPARPVH